MDISCDNIPREYPRLLDLVLKEGEWVSPRSLRTLEVRGLSIKAENPLKRFFGHPSRNANPIFAIVELMWYLSGDDSPTMISHYVSAVLHYLNPKTGRFDGAYGPRLRKFSGYVDQVESLRRRFSVDRDTRRAVISLYDPVIDSSDASANIPCQVMHQFLVRNERLEMITYARSQDMHKGFVYDTAEWQLFQNIVSGWLGIDVGPYRLYMGSAHLYEDDIPKSSKIIEKDKGFDLYENIDPLSAGLTFEQFEDIRSLFERVESMTRVPQSEELKVFHNTVKMIKLLENQFWKDAMFGLVSFNAFKSGHFTFATSLLDSMGREFRALLSEWFARKHAQTVEVT